jgi:RecA-family ATPase
MTDDPGLGKPPPEAAPPQNGPALTRETLPAALLPMANAPKPRWVIWKWVPGKPKADGKPGKPTKPPYQARYPTQKAASDDPSTWGTFDEAARAAPDFARGGVGYMLLDDVIAAVDLDHCRDAVTGSVEPWALALVERCNSYCEVTPSGTGLRIIGLAEGAHVHRKFNVPGTAGSVEFYRRTETGRFITVTGWQWDSSASALANLDAVMDEEVARLDEAKQQQRPNGAAEFAFASEPPEIEISDLDLSLLGEAQRVRDTVLEGRYGDWKGDRSRAVFFVACQLLRAAVPHDHILAILLNRAYAISQHIYDQNNPRRTAEKAIRDARGKLEQEPQNEEPKPQPLPFIDMSNWDNIPVPKRPWAVADRIPLRQPTLFTGEGAAGKSLIELQLCVAHVLGSHWLGSSPEAGPAIYFGAEDEQDELHRRLADIAGHYEVKFADLVRNGLHLLSFAGEDALLGVPDRNKKIVPTPLFNQFLEASRDIKPKHIGLDTSADVFGGDEINRAQVRQFVGLLRKLAMAGNCAVVLLAHPSLTGINSGTGLSGSTGWHNSVRARMYLRSPKIIDDERQPDSDLRELEFLKNQYGRMAPSIVLRYRNGVFVPEAGRTAFDQAMREQTVDTTFKDVLRKFIDLRQPLSPKPQGSNYAPKKIHGHPDGKAYTRKEYEAAMERLINRGDIHIANFGPQSRGLTHLAFPAV